MAGEGPDCTSEEQRGGKGLWVERTLGEQVSQPIWKLPTTTPDTGALCDWVQARKCTVRTCWQGRAFILCLT